MIELERESLRVEIIRNRQDVIRSEKRLKEKTDEYMAKNLPQMTRQAEEREKGLRVDLEHL